MAKTVRTHGRETVIPWEEMVKKIHVATGARQKRETMIMARTDAIAVEGFESALDRAEKYKEAGADILFVEAPQNTDQMTEIPRRLNAPCLANMVEGGKTPFLNAQELEQMGYAVVIYPISALLSVAKLVANLAQTFKQGGSSADSPADMMTFSEFNELVGLRSYLELDS